jgi:hypothetical protein
MHAFIGERHGAGASQTLARCAHDGAAAFDPKIHCLAPVISDGFFKSGAGTLAKSGAPDKGPAAF